MARQVYVICIVALFVQSSISTALRRNEKKFKRVAGGTAAGELERSWLLALDYTYEKCTGSLIAVDAVLTVAHCITGPLTLPAKLERMYFVGSGTTVLWEAGTSSILVDDIIYQPGAVENFKDVQATDPEEVMAEQASIDAAIIKFTGNLVKHSKLEPSWPDLKPIKLPSKGDKVMNYNECYIAGFGCTSNTASHAECAEWNQDCGLFSRKARRIPARLYEETLVHSALKVTVKGGYFDKDCKKYLYQAPFGGDSGGPVYCVVDRKPVLVGVNSIVIYPQGFVYSARVQGKLDWIKKYADINRKTWADIVKIG